MILSYFASFSRKENSMAVAAKLLKELNVNFTAIGLENNLYNHPNYPSLLSISDTLTDFGVQNITVKCSIDKLVKLPFPCIAPIRTAPGSRELFTVIKNATDDEVTYYHPEKNCWQSVDNERFVNIWSNGIILLADAENATGERNYTAKLREEKQINRAKIVAWLSAPFFTIVSCIFSLVTYGRAAGVPVIFTSLTLCGFIISSLLLWYEIDSHNPVLKQICGAGKKVNCGAILNSKAAKIAGTSWSVIGFTYFAGGLLTQLFFGIFNNTVWFVLAWTNVLAVPYIFFSVYYQWRIAKQWCLLCLAVQGLLLLQLITATVGTWHNAIQINTLFNNATAIPILLVYGLPFIVVNLLMPVYRMAKESKITQARLQRLKHNPQIFDALLEKQKAVTESVYGLGILLGHPNAGQKIIKVCNPYCGPCASAHTPMEELLRNNPDVQLQIIFTSTNAEADRGAKPVKHLLAIAAKGLEDLTLKALDDWYLADDKDYDVFASKYPMNGELKQQDYKIRAMMDWCDKTQIAFTPTFFVNGRQLPDVYQVGDLKYFLSV